jgi:pimeloyl-ACP methyl ester carboxylesterase
MTHSPDPQPWSKTLTRKRAISEDGTGISYQVMGEGDKVLLLANGLGGRLYAWEPIVNACWRDYRLVTWDYRGLFDSDTPSHPKRLAINNHAEDGLAILRAEGVRRAVLMGWSMGVQVSLELAATAPELVGGLVLLNGTYGQVLGTGFQPVFSVPFLPKRLHAFLEWLQRHPNASSRVAAVTRIAELPTSWVLALTSGARSAEFRAIIRQYFGDVLGPSFQNFLRLFQELDAHSVYHLLPGIDAPALVISGALDPLTPAYQSREIARRLPHAEHLALFRASHFALMERPQVVLPAIDRFLQEKAQW